MTRHSGITAPITRAARGIGVASARTYIEKCTEVALAGIRVLGGQIINPISQACWQGTADAAEFDATKAASVSAPQSVGLNFTTHGRSFKAVAPGFGDGKDWDGADALFADGEGSAPAQKTNEDGKTVPYGRIGWAENLTGMAVFLASKEADYIVAETRNVDGGQWMS